MPSSHSPNVIKESNRQRKTRAAEIVRRLHEEYPDAGTALSHRSALQLLIATILSAQCTDVQVNLVTPGLFLKYPDAAAFASADREELEQEIHSTGFYHNKARSIILCCQQLVERFDGQVPVEMADLVKLAGVGRKTANCVRGAAFQLPAITVDTHVGRLARRLALTSQNNPDKVESDIQSLVPEEYWYSFSNALIWHGRRVCHSRKPECARCIVADLCPSRESPSANASKSV